MKIYLETKRLILRDISEDDVHDLFQLDSDPEVNKYFGDTPVSSVKESLDIIGFIQKQYVENGMGRLAVLDKKTNAFLGWSGIKYEKKVRDDFNYFDLGYRFMPKYWGKGIATEAAIESLRYGFEVLKLKEICAAAHVDNIGSNRVLIKSGMTLKEDFHYDGAKHNWYVISNSLGYTQAKK